MADDLSGRILGERFELLSQLGEGGYGAVYLAEQITMGRKVAIKVINPRVIDTDDFVERFEREARVASRLQHPNTVVYFDFGQDADLHFLAMEFVDGRTLGDDINDSGPTGVARAAHMARQICGALSEAHKMGMVHRDLKPGNILLTERGGDPDFVKVIDFGLAKIVQGDSEISRRDLTSEGMLLGTPAYMSPEQIRGKPVDARCDIYALGVILFVMLTGEKPYDGDTPLGTAVMHLTEAIPLVRERNPGLPPEIENLVWRCMAKEPDERPASVDELAIELEQILRQVGPTVSGSMYLRQTPSGIRPLAGDGTPSGHTATLDPTPSTQSGQQLGRRVALLGADPSSKTIRRASDEVAAVPPLPAPEPSRALVMTLLAVLVVAVGVTLALVIGPLGGRGEAADEVAAASDPAGTPEAGSASNSASALDSDGSASEHPLGTGSAVDHESLLLADPADLAEAVEEARRVVDPAWFRAIAAASQLAVRQSREAERSEAEEENERSERRRRREARDDREDDDDGVEVAAVEPEPAQEGHLRITAVPWGRVFCNGAPFGRTPIDEVVPVGTYDCRIVSPRGQEEQRQVSVSVGGSRVVRVRFEP